MIEIAVDEQKDRLLLVVDGVTYEDPITVLPVPLSGSGDGVGLLIHPRLEELSELLLNKRFSEFPQEPWLLELRFFDEWVKQNTVIESELYHPLEVCRTKSGQMYLGFEIHFDTDNWKRLWSISEYRLAFDDIVKDHAVASELPPTERIPQFPYGSSINPKMWFNVTNCDSTIAEEIRAQRVLLEQLHDLTRAYLESQLKADSVVVRFEFPEEAKTACEQYLLYFVQFLKDLGVEATAELERQASQVLFTVTPQSKDEALDKIRAALDVYLSIPIGNLNDEGANIATQRLASNVYHLRSQLALAQAVIQAKDATIEAQQATLTLTQQRYLLPNSVVIDSLVETSKPTHNETETVLDGLAEITKYQGKGFNINLPEIFRRLRELFAKD